MPGLNPSQHYTEQHLISLLATGKEQTIEDIKTSQVEHYETLSDLFSLYRTLSKDRYEDRELLTKFSFLMQWPNLSQEEKEEKYSLEGCTELNFFIYNKDQGFFESAVKPYLRNKVQKTFMDQWFLGYDLTEWLEPFNFSKLNTLEQILLGVRIPQFGKHLGKAYTDRASLIAKDPEEFIRLFKTALESRTLDTAAKGGLIPKEARDARKPERLTLAEQKTGSLMPAAQQGLALGVGGLTSSSLTSLRASTTSGAGKRP